jgi:hypothetical protein
VKSNFSRKIEETLMKLQFIVMFECLMGQKQSERNQEGKKWVDETLRCSLWKIIIAIHSLITFVRLGIEMIWLFSGSSKNSQSEMDDQ